MSKKKDNRQLLIESSEFTTKINITKELKESLEISKGKSGTLIVRNIPCTILNRENQNGRIYSTEVMQEALNNAKNLRNFELKKLLGKPNEHPEGSYIAPSEASHVIINAYIKPNTKLVVEDQEEVDDVLFMDWEILNTRNGQDLRALFEAECSIGVSIRGLGDLNGKNVSNYEILGVDCVGNPSSSTFTRMPVSESVKVELQDPRNLQETYTVTTSSTNVVKDLEKAAQLQAELDNIGYGTVIKTSTKLDSETDPKTGAETTITTLEAETSDDVGDLDQALMMAKNAMLNGRVSIDSITIENVKEEEPKESAENTKDEKALNEEEKDPMYLALKKSNFYRFNTPEEYMQFINDNVNYLDNGYSLPEAEKIFAEYTNNKISPELACHKLEGFISNITNKTFKEDEYIPESEMSENNTMTEATEEKKDPKEGKKFVLKTPSGFVAMDGNALVFKDDPKQALHFIYGKEESGLVHLSGVEKILDAMGVYDVEKYFRKPTTDISVSDEIADNEDTIDISTTTEQQPTQECNLKEEDTTGGKFTALVRVEENNGSTTQEEIPVASIELDSMQNEIGNLYQTKSQKGRVQIQIRDNTTGAMYVFNPETKAFDALQESNNGEVEQDDNKLSVKVDDDHTVEKEFDSEAQASVAKAGIEQGKLDGNVMLSEEDKHPEYENIEPGWYVSCPQADKLGLDIGITGPYKTREEALAGMEEFEPYLNVEEVTEEEADMANEILAAESTEMDEVLFKNKSNASDPYIDETLNEEIINDNDSNDIPDEEDVNSDPNEEVIITLGNIDWDVESLSASDEDVDQMIMDLPDTLELTVKAGDLDNDEPEKVRETLMDLANKSSSMKINNATILDIK